MRPLPILSASLAGCLVLAACGDISGLLPAAIANRTDTVSVYALTGTPVSSPSAYSIQARSVIRTDVNSAFDFAFDIDSLGRVMLLPTGALKLGLQSGAQLSALEFDSLTLAPSSGYKIDSAVVITENTVAVMHSRLVQCSYDYQPSHNYFAKLHVLAIDTLARSIRLEILTNINCGYRGLEPGLPKH
jgi:hypothetical protein